MIWNSSRTKNFSRVILLWIVMVNITSRYLVKSFCRAAGKLIWQHWRRPEGKTWFATTLPTLAGQSQINFFLEGVFYDISLCQCWLASQRWDYWNPIIWKVIFPPSRTGTVIDYGYTLSIIQSHIRTLVWIKTNPQTLFNWRFNLGRKADMIVVKSFPGG